MSFFPILELPAHASSEIDGGGALTAILEGHVRGAVVRGAVPAAALEPAVTRLQAAAAGTNDTISTRASGVLEPWPLVRRDFSPRFAAHSYGHIIDHAQGDLGAYFAEVAPYARLCDALFAPYAIAAQVMAQLARLVGPRTLRVAEHPQHGRYTWSTIRAYPQNGGRIPPHAELEQWPRAPYAHLRSMLQPGCLLSWYLMLQAAETGGELGVYDVTLESAEGQRIVADRGQAEALLHGRTREDLVQAAGDLLLFDGGRHFHEVRPVAGSRARWTLGGFCGLHGESEAWIWS